MAKSTLIHALQTERDNVHELKAVLSSLQSNNSAIADMVSSRDSLINELNDRVGVFEEDKLVLKAALRQLQKEMKEEATKTQKLVSDLKSTKECTSNNHIHTIIIRIMMMMMMMYAYFPGCSQDGPAHCLGYGSLKIVLDNEVITMPGKYETSDSEVKVVKYNTFGAYQLFVKKP